NEQTEPDLLSEENDNDAFPDSEENEIPVVQSESKDDELIVEVNADNDLNDRDLNDETISEGGLKESHALVVDEEPILVEEDNVVDVPVSENNIEDLPASEDKIEETPLVEETIENDDNSEDKVEQEETKLFYEPVEAERKNEKNFPWLPIISVLLLIALAVVLIFIYKEEQRLIEEQSLYVYVDEDAFQKAYKDGAIDKLPGTQDDVQEEDSMIAPENEVDSLINSQAVDSISLTQNKTLEIEPQTASTSVNPEQVAPPVKVKESPEKTENTPKATTALKQRQLAAGETLRILAEKEFGSREFWVYIYLKNKAKIPNPNSVKVGTLLTIPDKTEYGGIDANDPNSIKRAKLAASKL
ncbi:hypothetical protein LJC06_04845, partial [Bacteroidales bacterium OttesenSCG-928-I14]|nr:hypothetical protein [Bacteroidales bacterium OttesenSCG-928-I14]